MLPGTTTCLIRSGRAAVTAAVALAACLLALPAAADAQTSYSISDLGAYATPVGVNAAGQVAINQSNAQAAVLGPARWAGGVTTALTSSEAPADESTADGISGTGEIVGNGYSIGLSWPTPSTETSFDSPIPSKGPQPGQAYIGVGAVDASGEVAINVGDLQGDDIAQAWASPSYGADLEAISSYGDPVATGFSTTLGVNGGHDLYRQTPSYGATPFSYELGSLSGGAAPVTLDFPACGLASDGTTVGPSSAAQSYGSGTLRLPDGTEEAIPVTPSCSAQPYSVNAAHDVIGLAAGGVDSLYANGTTSSIASLFPPGSGWSAATATEINDQGDIIGTGTYGGVSHGFLLTNGIVVNSTGDGDDANPGDGTCATSGGACTLRAAIEEVNAEPSSDSPISIRFAIPGIAAHTIPTLHPASPLPAITKPVSIDGTSQPAPLSDATSDGTSGLTLGVIIDGAGAGASADGLDLQAGAAGTVVKGLQIQHFGGGDGVLLAGADEQVADSLLTSDHVGVEVAASNDVVGAGNGLLGDIFFADGSPSASVQYTQGLSGQTTSPAALAAAQLQFGAGVLLTKPSAGAQINGDAIGVHGGFGFGSSDWDKLPGDGFPSTLFSGTPSAASLSGASVSATGILIDPTSGQISDVTIGGAKGPASDVVAGNILGLVVETAGGSVSGVSIGGSLFGSGVSIDGLSDLGTRNSASEYLDPLGNLIGLTASGNVSGLQVGEPGQGNVFDEDMVGLAIDGASVEAPEVQANTFGGSFSLGSVLGPTGGGLSLQGDNGFGVLLSDTTDALVGGPAGSGNTVASNLFGVVIAGDHASGNVIQGNTVGRVSSPASPLDFTDLTGISDLIGIGAFGPASGSAPVAQGTVVIGNTWQENVFGLFSVLTSGMTVQGNTAQGNLVGLFDVGSGGEQIGGSAAGQGNSFLADNFGLFLANYDPTPTDLQQAQVNANAVSEGTRQQALSEPDENLVFDDVDATTSAGLGPTSAQTPAAPGTQNTIVGNLMGVDGSGNANGNIVAALVAGDEHGVQIGGIAPGQGNTIENSAAAGLWLIGTGPHSPTAQILGNTIYNNENFTSNATGIPGLGIDLINAAGSASDPLETVGGFGFGVNPQDTTQPDSGPDNLQNAPVLTSATTSSGQLTITGTLHGVASTNYVLEVFADQNQNPFGAGEGQTLLERINLATDASGNAEFSSTVAVPASSYRFVSSTATTVPASGLGVTSEFSVNAPITAATGVTPAGAVSGSGTSGGSTGTATAISSLTTSTAKTTTSSAGGTTGSSATTVTSSGSTVAVIGTGASGPISLPETASCSSATSTPCTVTTTATIPSNAAGKASTAATKKKKKKKKKKKHAKSFTIGHGSLTLAPGAHAVVRFRLNPRGRALLRARHTLVITVTVKITGRDRATVTRAAQIQLTYKSDKTAKAKRKH